MAKKDCPFCEGKKWYLIASTNIEIACEFCVKGIVPKPKNFDAAKLDPTLFARLQSGFGRLITKNS